MKNRHRFTKTGSGHTHIEGRSTQNRAEMRFFFSLLQVAELLQRLGPYKTT